MLVLIKNGYIVDPLSKREGIYDLLVKGDRIIKIAPANSISGNMDVDSEEVTLIDASGKYILPGFIDLHVHLREPGYEYKETIKTGSLAAAAGGFTSICPMPNTNPATDCPESIRYILQKSREEAIVNILPIGAITIGQKGIELADVKGMVGEGAIALSEDGKSVMNSSLYLEGMRQAAKHKIPVFAHCEDKELVGEGVINEGYKAKEFNLKGISNAVEDIIVARDIILAKQTGASLHLCHCSTKDSVKFIQMAKQEGLPVTGEVCPHHFILTEDNILSDDANYKMNPPLRSLSDKKALLEALKYNIIDVIATDHAPHSDDEKEKSFSEAPFGIVGLETAFALTYTELVKTGILSLQQMVEKMSCNPAAILGIDRGCIDEGMVADFILVDINEEYVIDKYKFYSKGKNTPFHGRKVFGKVLYTFVAGKMVFSRNDTN